MASLTTTPQVSVDESLATPLSNIQHDFDNSLAGMGVSNIAQELESESLGDPNAPAAANGITIDTSSNPILDALGGAAFGAAQPAVSSAVNKLTSGLQGFWSDLFLRTIVIITGFIFLAIGLSMFKAGDASAIVRAVKPR